MRTSASYIISRLTRSPCSAAAHARSSATVLSASVAARSQAG